MVSFFQLTRSFRLLKKLWLCSSKSQKSFLLASDDFLYPGSKAFSWPSFVFANLDFMRAEQSSNKLTFDGILVPVQALGYVALGFKSRACSALLTFGERGIQKK